MDDDLDFDALAERTLRPQRARLADAVAVTYDWAPAMVRSWLDACDAPDDITAAIEASALPPLDEVGTASEAWERLAAHGVIPYEYVDAPGRRFGLSAVYGDEYDPDLLRFRDAWSRPRSLRACVALGSDAAGIAAAESLATEFVRALAPWGWRTVDRVIWCVRPRTDRLCVPFTIAGPRVARGSERGLDAIAACLSDALPTAVASSLRAFALFDDPDWFWPPGHATEAIEVLAYVLEVARLWRLACERGYSVAQPPFARAATVPIGARFDALPDPYAPLLAIWRLGYALEAVSDEAVVLVAPELGS